MSIRPLLLLLFCVLTASEARADLGLPKEETWLMVGPLFSNSARDSGTGVGLEASLNFVNDFYAMGVFGQAQRLEDEHTRLSVGLQGNLTLLGLELGVMHETANRAHAATTGLHIAPYFSFIYGSVGFRLGIPLYAAEESRPRYGVEGAVVLSLKMPMRLGRGEKVPFFHL
ncbi:hypothetical protein [Corallococcus sp. EGB]|uniref:hypothetical protein n=1 Tax=Corallococcus sp. EGB TaxID=1521117 RepID=UPI001CBE30C1|nr:hypothetical protein [Corallococcus sp. EGB]